MGPATNVSALVTMLTPHAITTAMAPFFDVEAVSTPVQCVMSVTQPHVPLASLAGVASAQLTKDSEVFSGGLHQSVFVVLIATLISFAASGFACMLVAVYILRSCRIMGNKVTLRRTTSNETRDSTILEQTRVYDSAIATFDSPIPAFDYRRNCPSPNSDPVLIGSMSPKIPGLGSSIWAPVRLALSLSRQGSQD